MSEALRITMKKLAKEIQKHAERDDCYECKQLIATTLVSAFLDKGESK